MASKKKLGIVLSTPPENPNLKTALGLLEAASIKNIQSYLYLIDEGVKNVKNPKIECLSQQGLKWFACAYSAQRYGISIDRSGVFGGLVLLSDLLKVCDRVVVLN